MALNQATEQISDYKAQFGQSYKAVDGNTYGHWNAENPELGSISLTADKDTNPWWKVTLAKRSYISYIEVIHGNIV